MSRRDWGDVAAAVFVLAALGFLVRPGSVAPTLIKMAGEAMTALVGFAVSSSSSGGGQASTPGSVGGVLTA